MTGRPLPFVVLIGCGMRSLEPPPDLYTAALAKVEKNAAKKCLRISQ